MNAMRMVYLLLSACLLAGPATAVNNVQEKVLPNGLKVLVKEVRSAPVVVVDVWYRVGSRNEGPGMTGASHLLEHMTYKGTREFAKDDMRNLTKRNGALDNGATFFDYTHYYTTIASDRLELVLRMEASRMTSALIRQTDLDSERTVVRSELEGRENNPGTLLFQEVMSAMFRSHPYRWPVIGWRADVEHITAEQLRAYYHAYYVPNNATLVIVGDVDAEKALALVAKHFSRIRRGSVPSQWVTPELPQYGERRVTIKRQGTVPMEIMAWRMPAKTHQDIPALFLLEQILGGGRTSRLHQRIVETQLGVGAWASAMVNRDAGVFYAGGVAAPGQALTLIDAALSEEIERIKTTPPTATEVARAYRQYEAALIFDRDSVTDVAGQLGEAETTTGSWRYPDELLVKMRQVTPEEISRVANTYLVENNRTIGIFQPIRSTGAAVMPPAVSAAQLTRANNKPLDAVASSPGPGNAAVQASLRRRLTMPNGMVVIVQENHANPTVAISASLKAGKAYAAPGKAGTADLAANLLDRGTETRTSYQIAEEMEGAAATLQIGTGWETVGAHGKALSGDLEVLLRNLADQLRYAVFPLEEIAKIREQMLASVEMDREQPDEAARRAFYRAVLPEGHPYRLHSFDEEVAGLRAITRDDLLTFYRAHYTPKAMILSVVGDVNIDTVRQLVDRYFGDWQGPSPTMLTFPPVESPASRVVTSIADKSEVEIYVGHAGELARTDPEYYAAEIMNMILGGGGALNSRLGSVIRDQHGLAYSVYSDFHASTGAGPWYAVLGVNPGNVNKAIPLLQAEITRMRDHGATQQEVNDAIAYLTGAYALTLQTNAAMANVLMDAEYFQLGLDYPERVSKHYRTVTRAQVNAAAKRYLHPDQLTVSIAGSYKQE